MYSAATWYRDYVAYCGISDDGNKRFAFVVELNRRKPVLKKPLPGTLPDDAPQTQPAPPPSGSARPHVSPSKRRKTKQTFAIRGHVVDLVDESEEEEGN